MPHVGPQLTPDQRKVLVTIRQATPWRLVLDRDGDHSVAILEHQETGKQIRLRRMRTATKLIEHGLVDGFYAPVLLAAGHPDGAEGKTTWEGEKRAAKVVARRTGRPEGAMIVDQKRRAGE